MCFTCCCGVCDGKALSCDGTKRALSLSVLMQSGHMIAVSSLGQKSVFVVLCVWVCAHAQILLLHTNVDVCVSAVCLCV